jgi:hypothetical protein
MGRTGNRQRRPALRGDRASHPLRWLRILLTAFGAVGIALNVLGVIVESYNLNVPNFGIPPEDADVLIPVVVPPLWLGPPVFLVAIVWWIVLFIRKRRSQRGG